MAQIAFTPSALALGHDERAVSGFRLRRISWGAVMAGAVTAVGLQLLFTVMGLALGVTVARPEDGVSTTEAADTAQAIGIGAGVWWLVTGLIALFIGAFVTGRLRGACHRMELSIHGLALWAVVAVFGFAVIWSGAGMLTDAASPLATLVVDRSSTARYSNPSNADPVYQGVPLSESQRTDASGEVIAQPERDTTLSPESRAQVRASAADAYDAARAASWWSVIGLLAGIGACALGANAGTSRRWRRGEDLFETESVRTGHIGRTDHGARTDHVAVTP